MQPDRHGRYLFFWSKCLASGYHANRFFKLADSYYNIDDMAIYHPNKELAYHYVKQ